MVMILRFVNGIDVVNVVGMEETTTPAFITLGGVTGVVALLLLLVPAPPDDADAV